MKTSVRQVETTDLDLPRSEFRLPVTVVLDRLRSAFNVGNIFRLAEALQADGIVACGYTPAPPHPKLAKTARGCDQTVQCASASDTADAVQELKNNGVTVYAVETVADAVSIWELEIKFPAAFVFGNEALGIAPETLDKCDAAVLLPRFGRKNSMNVANAAAVVLYTAARQWHEKRLSIKEQIT